MLTVRNLSKSYGSLRALKDVSFEVHAGEVVGFLGPNGAGKSTTMRIVTGFIPASGGTARIDGLDVSRYPLEVRRLVGYLPEHTPLYGEMRVRDYLEYRARIKGVPRREAGKRVDYVIERTWLKDRSRQIIETLSKGYRQRVGIADAMVGNPRLLVLDEPTIGLDPNQVREVRGLIKELGETHTLLLSTHILSEVEAVCDRVIIVSEGRTVADDTVAGILRRHQEPAVRIVLDSAQDARAVLQAVGRLPGVRGASVGEGNLETRSYRVELEDEADPAAVLRAISALVAEQHWALFELGPERITLEQIFVGLTQGSLGRAAQPAAGEPAAGEAAAGEAAASEPPAPKGEAPKGEAPKGEAPKGEAPNGEAPNGEAAAGEAAAGEAAAGEAPKGEAPAGEADEAPAGEAPAAAPEPGQEGA